MSVRLKVTGSKVDFGVGRFSVSPSATDFLVVGLHVLGSSIVNDSSDVGFVDPHAKGDRAYDGLALVMNKLSVTLRPLRHAHSGVVSTNLDHITKSYKDHRI